MWKLVAMVACLVAAGPAAARTFESCSSPQEKVAGAAIDGARELAIRAAAAVGDTPQFLNWFGTFSVAHGEEVRANLKAIHATLIADDLRAVCLHRRMPDCEGGTYAYILF